MKFDWFDKLFSRREYPTWKDIPAVNTIGDDMNKVIPFPELKAVPESATTPAECYYTVGTDSDGKVVLKVGGTGYVTTTLTMTVDATRQMIRLLEAAMPQDEFNMEDTE